MGVLPATAAPLWLSIPITGSVLDLVSDAWHRANHIIPVLWRHGLNDVVEEAEHTGGSTAVARTTLSDAR